MLNSILDTINSIQHNDTIINIQIIKSKIQILEKELDILKLQRENNRTKIKEIIKKNQNTI